MLPVLGNRSNLMWPETNDWVDREFGRMMRRFWGGDSTAGEGYITYPVNIWEDDEAVHVEAEMPGFQRDQIDITLEQGVLSISAERKSEQPAGANGRSPLLNERRFVRYHRSFTLPSAVEEPRVEARLEDGVLHLSLPKRAEVKPRRIKVS